ncbi:MAG TPA: hypothetical protein VHX86_15125 [Tepidisphaeraceae bacterium]|jgi:hypothetical protein|nr:hypothetical protein [Tepidisphaeraceae bacterium]
MTLFLKRCTVVLLVCFVCAAAGCSLLSIASNKAGADTAVKAKYVPNKKDSMLVLVESYGLNLDSPIESEHMNLTLNKTLAYNNVAPIVDQQLLERLRDANSQAYHQMTIADIGRKLGAKQVLYVNITRAELEKPPGSGQVRGHMEALVKIVDSQSADTRWPTDSPSEFVQITTNWAPQTPKETDNDIRAQMSDQMAEDIGKLFYDSQIDQEEMPKVNVE